MTRHIKHPGYVLEIESPTSWWGRLIVDGVDYDAQFIVPLPAGCQDGQMFTLHRTKRGVPYFYWPPGRRPLSSRERKRIATKVKEWTKLFDAEDPPGTKRRSLAELQKMLKPS